MKWFKKKKEETHETKEEVKKPTALESLRESSEQICKQVSRIWPKASGRRRVRVIKHLSRLKTPPVRSAKKTKRKAWHAVKPAGSKSHFKPLCAMQLRLFCGE